MGEMIKLVHPGEILLDTINDIGITQYRLAKGSLLSPTRISEIIKGKRSITPNTALKIGKFLGTGPEYWMNLQTRYDIEVECLKNPDLKRRPKNETRKS